MFLHMYMYIQYLKSNALGFETFIYKFATNQVAMKELLHYF
jgi:hypothetical protein